MTDYYQQYQPPIPPPVQPAPSKHRFPLWAIIVSAVVGFLVVLVVGVGIGASGGSAQAAKPGPTVSVTGPPAGTVTATATTTAVQTATVTDTPPAPTATVTYTPVPAVAFTDGQFAVPTEVTPGRYHTDGGSQCYYAVLSSLDGSLDSIITNDNFTGPTTISISAKAAGVQTNGGCSWTKVG